MSALIARASDIITDLASSVAWQAGTPDPDYPVTNVSDRVAHTVAKVAGASGTLRVSFAAPRTLEAIACIHTNATAIVVTNAAGLNETLSLPAMTEDGLPLDPWIDLRGLANTSSAQWDIALSGPAGLGIGELLLVQTLRSLDFFLGTVRRTESHPTIRHLTDYRVALTYGMGVRSRGLSGVVKKQELEAAVSSLGRDLRGALRGALLVEDPESDEAMYVDLVNDREMAYGEPGEISVRLDFIEQQKGLAL